MWKITTNLPIVYLSRTWFSYIINDILIISNKKLYGYDMAINAWMVVRSLCDSMSILIDLYSDARTTRFWSSNLGHICVGWTINWSHVVILPLGGLWNQLIKLHHHFTRWFYKSCMIFILHISLNCKKMVQRDVMIMYSFSFTRFP